MEKLSVKKPFTILVAVIMVLVLGVVSLTGMTTDLLPNMSLPYLIVVTTYPGASPERVESDVIRPLEGALGTVNGVQNIYSTSSENYGTVQLEFEDGTDMDSTLVKVNSALQEVTGSLPEMCGTPSVIELSMDMMATMYVSVSREGYDIYQLSAFVEGTVKPFLERQDGVASISGIGLVDQSIHIELDEKKIDKLNEKLLESINDSLAKAKEELDKAENEVIKGKEELSKAQAGFGQTLAGGIFDQIEGEVLTTADELKQIVDTLLTQVKALRSEITDGETGHRLDSLIAELETLSNILAADEIAYEDLLLAAGSLRVIAKDLSVLLDKISNAQPGATENPSLAVLRQQLTDIENSLTELSDFIDSLPELLAGLESAVAGLTQAQLDAAVGFATASSQLTAAEAQLSSAKTQYETAKAEALSKANLDQLLSVSTLSQLPLNHNMRTLVYYLPKQVRR